MLYVFYLSFWINQLKYVSGHDSPEDQELLCGLCMLVG
jgi:hypothetical protein